MLYFRDLFPVGAIANRDVPPSSPEIITILVSITVAFPFGPVQTKERFSERCQTVPPSSVPTLRAVVIVPFISVPLVCVALLNQWGRTSLPHAALVDHSDFIGPRKISVFAKRFPIVPRRVFVYVF